MTIHPHIESLSLTSFRSYPHARMEDLSNGFIILHGANGAGKTNVLEALSLLTPGRGLRNARYQDMQFAPTDENEAKHATGQSWAVSAHLANDIGGTQLGTGQDPASTADKRIIRIDGETVRNQARLAEHLSLVWLTPQMDRLFLDSASQRRRFFDRFLFAYDPAHSTRINKYDQAMSRRSKILRENPQNYDPDWVKSLEDQMVELGIAIAAARLSFMQRLQGACDHMQDTAFPKAHLRLHGTVEELLINAPALEVEGLFAFQLEQSRARDAIVGGAATGPHKTDLIVTYADKNREAAQCSTGEQKALLIGMVIAHAQLIHADRGAPPILLLDEIAAHLDDSRRKALFDLLHNMGGQTWITGTEPDIFQPLHAKKAQSFSVNQGTLTQDA